MQLPAMTYVMTPARLHTREIGLHFPGIGLGRGRDSAGAGEVPARDALADLRRRRPTQGDARSHREVAIRKAEAGGITPLSPEQVAVRCSTVTDWRP